jgi:hypothetical protein
MTKYTTLTNLLQITVHFRKSHRQPQCNLQLACAHRFLFMWVDLYVSKEMGSDIQNKSEKFFSCIHVSLVNLILYLTPQPKIEWSYVCRFKQLYLGHHSELNICRIWTFSSPSSPIIVAFPPQSPCVTHIWHIDSPVFLTLCLHGNLNLW